MATRLHVVRQTVSKWEKGISVPDADMLQNIAEELEVNVQELLGDEINQEVGRNEIAEQLSRINEQMAIRNRRSLRIRKTIGVILLTTMFSCILLVMFRYFIDKMNSNKLVDTSKVVQLPDLIEVSNLDSSS